MQELFKNSPRLESATYALIIILCVFVGVKSFAALKSMQFIGSGTTATNTIQVSGTAEVLAVPDIATINFTLNHDAKTTVEAQNYVTDLEKKVLAYLKSQGIAEKDIKTENYSSYPKYEWRDDVVMKKCIEGSCPPNGRNVIVSYTASETVTVKVRNVDNAGTIITGLGGVGVTDISGPNFMIDNDEGIKLAVRAKAIDDAKDKAKILSKQLGVTLIRIVNFNDNSGGYPMPMYAKADMAGGMAESVPPAQFPKGENKYTSNVTITYEIR